jgi:putative hemolysin
MLMELELFLAAILVLGLLVMSVLDFALGAVNKIALRRITENRGGQQRQLTEALAAARAEVLMVIHIAIQTLLVALAVLLTGTFLSYPLVPIAALPLAGATTLIIVLTFRQLIPRALALRSPDEALERLIPVLAIPYFILRPLARMITTLLNRFNQWDEIESEEEEEASEDEIQAFIDAGQEEGILEQDEGVMIQSIVQFGDKVALEVMTPRTQITAADVAWTFDRFVSQILSSKHSRMPVYRDELDNIEGFIHERDLLRLNRSGGTPDSLRPFLQPVHFVPETKPIDDLLEEMKSDGQQLVLVVDEYGGISGLITIEDLLEEIVGEISDSPGAESAKLLDEGRGSYLVPGTTELDVLDARLGVTAFSDTECTTVSGAVVELFGRLPLSGERIRHERLAIEVVDADRRKVRSLRIRTLASKSG